MGLHGLLTELALFLQSEIWLDCLEWGQETWMKVCGLLSYHSAAEIQRKSDTSPLPQLVEIRKTQLQRAV
jgi:hypothetical protein